MIYGTHCQRCGRAGALVAVPAPGERPLLRIMVGGSHETWCAECVGRYPAAPKLPEFAEASS